MKKLSASDIKEAKRIARENFESASEISDKEYVKLPHFKFKEIYIVNPWMSINGETTLSDEEAIKTYGLANVINLILQLI